jgi:dTDP-D-glucose 4,6-dehydratase
MTFGPYQADEKLVPYIIRSALNDLSPKLSSCNRRADWIYVNDVIDGFIATMTTEGIEGMTFEFGTGKLRTTRSVVEALLKVLGNRVEPLFGAIDDRPGEDPRPALTVMTKRRLSWNTTTPFDRALRDTASWYIRNRFSETPHAAASTSVKLRSSFPFTTREGNLLF